jgi:hypothetical protein
MLPLVRSISRMYEKPLIAFSVSLHQDRKFRVGQAAGGCVEDRTTTCPPPNPVVD